MKKVIIFFLALILLLIPVTTKAATNQDLTTLKIHYFRYDGDYENGWDVWLWPEDGNGAGFAFDRVDGKIVTDSFGAVATVDISSSDFNVERIGVILRKGAWEAKDVDMDRFIELSKHTTGDTLNVYFVEGDIRIGYNSETDPEGPERSNKIRTAYFTDTKTISYSLTAALTADKLSLSVDGVVASATITPNKNKGTIKISADVDLTKKYELTATFDDGVKTYLVTFDGIYDSDEFNDAYAYDGDDLGATVNGNTTTFKVWAPISSTVVLNIYNTGTPGSLSGGTNTPTQTLTMTKGEKGVWSLTVNENLHGKYYTYSVTNGSTTTEVVDPYAKSAGINGLRGMVVDFAQTNPSGFSYGAYAQNMTNPTDAIIYELHIRDLTSHSSWGGNTDIAGTFKAATVSDTTYTSSKGVTVTTGLDHIIELGVTHVQLVPVFDHGVIDETKPTFNWGYMPENYNVLEGSYSTDPYNGEVRITEFKELVKTFTDNNINVIMDVVYNHTGKTGDSNFNSILPGYYYRLNEDGSFSNGSGCGNETASERYMMRKFMVDSVTFWAEEYNIAGFRFDLMALHDITTMNAIADALHEINEHILIYGEPWSAGGAALGESDAANQLNLDKMPLVGAFNDNTRDAIKGSVFTAEEGGFVQWNTSADILNKLKFGIAGGVEIDGVTSSSLSYQKFWGTSPSKVINYVSCHDNNTLYDKIMQSSTVVRLNSDNYANQIKYMQKQANAIVLLSQGIPFIHAGAEFMRSKPLPGGGFDHNSYESPDSVNQLRWDRKADYVDVFTYYRDLIALRKAHPAFRLSTADEVTDHLTFLDTGKDTAVAYTISDYANGDSYGKILVIHSAGDYLRFTLPEGDWNLIANRDTISLDSPIKTYTSGSSVFVLENETVVLYQGYKAPATSGCQGCSGGFVSLLGLGVVLFTIRRRKEYLL